MRITRLPHPALCLACLALLLLSACEPLPPGGPGAGPRITATLLTAGEDVWVNNRPAASGQAIRPGDSLTTGHRSAARIEFSDRTTVEIIDATDPVHFDWSRDALVLRLDDAAAEVDKGEGFSIVRILSRFAELFSVSRFVVEERYPRFFRADLFSGRIEMVRPRPGTVIRPGEYVQVSADGRVDVGRTSPRRVEELRARFDRWDFSRAQLRRMPRLTDHRLAEALREIERAGLRPGRIVGPESRDSEVIGQRPRAGEQVAPGARVDLTVRPAETTARVPELRRLSYAEARRAIADSGLRVGTVQGAGSGDRYVASQDPAPGTQVRQGSRIDLVLRSREVATVRVPDVRQLLLSQATQALQRAGLKPGRISGPTQGDAVFVVRQSPSPGSRAARGSAVDLVVQGVIQ